MNELHIISASLRKKGLDVFAEEVDRLALQLSDDPVENVLGAYRHIHNIDELRRFAGAQTICAYWEGDNADWCDHYAEYSYNNLPMCYKHFRFIARREPTHHDLLEIRRTVATIRKNNLPKDERCPFGLSIPKGCMNAGEAVMLMDVEPHSALRNRKIFDVEKQGAPCIYAAKIVKKKKAVDCNFDTTTAGRKTPKLYRSSPIYPKLWEGFNTVNLDRNYHQYHDFNYVSVYG